MAPTMPNCQVAGRFLLGWGALGNCLRVADSGNEARKGVAEGRPNNPHS